MKRKQKKLENGRNKRDKKKERRKGERNQNSIIKRKD